MRRTIYYRDKYGKIIGSSEEGVDAGAAMAVQGIIGLIGFLFKGIIGIGAIVGALIAGHISNKNKAKSAGAFSASTGYTNSQTPNTENASAYLKRGLACYDNHDYDGAIAEYTQAIRLDPNKAGTYNNRGLAYGAKRDYDRAIPEYTQAIRLDPNYAKAYFNRALVYYNKADYDRAIADHTQAIRLDPNYAKAYYYRAIAYQAKGDIARANADFAKAYELGYR